MFTLGKFKSTPEGVVMSLTLAEMHEYLAGHCDVDADVQERDDCECRVDVVELVETEGDNLDEEQKAELAKMAEEFKEVVARWYALDAAFHKRFDCR
jgi:hypothetical protein